MSSIQDFQSSITREKIVDGLYKRGRRFSDFEVKIQMDEVFSKYTLGLPYYKPFEIEKYSKSDKVVYNESFKELQNDLETLYAVYKNHTEKVITIKKSYDNMFSKTLDAMSKISSSIETLDETLSTMVPRESKSIFFYNLENVNTRNLHYKNIYKTTCEINLYDALLTNTDITPPSARFNISDALINVQANVETVEINDNIKDILTENSLRVTNIKTMSMNPFDPSISIDIDLQKLITASIVELNAFNISNDVIDLYISRDGIDYFKKQCIVGKNSIIWGFRSDTFRYVKIVIKKGIVSDINGQHHTSTDIISLSITKAKYKKEDVFTSEPLDIVNGDRVKLETDDYSTEDTDIVYLVGYEDKDERVLWHSINKGEEIDLGLFTEEEYFPTYTTSDLFGTWVYDRQKQTEMFYIDKLKDNVEFDNVKLRCGYGQWLIESIDVAHKYKRNVPLNNKPTILDFDFDDYISICPMEMNTNEIRCERTDNYFSMSAYIVSSKDIPVYNRFIKMKENLGETLNISLYVNGQTIPQIHGGYSFRLNEGENHIRILVSLIDLNYDLNNLDNINTIVHNFNLLSPDVAVYASKELEQVNHLRLNDYAHKYRLDKFAIKEINGEKHIITKFDVSYPLTVHETFIPQTRDMSPNKSDKTYINNAEFFRVVIKYRYLKDEVKENIAYDKNGGCIRYRVMARLITRDRSVSPKIKEIKLVAR